jgi:hypothetical protein
VVEAVTGVVVVLVVAVVVSAGAAALLVDDPVSLVTRVPVVIGG